MRSVCILNVIYYVYIGYNNNIPPIPAPPSVKSEAVQLVADLVRRYLSRPKPFKRNGKWVTPRSVRHVPASSVECLSGVEYSELGGVAEEGGKGGGGEEEGGRATSKKGQKVRGWVDDEWVKG